MPRENPVTATAGRPDSCNEARNEADCRAGKPATAQVGKAACGQEKKRLSHGMPPVEKDAENFQRRQHSEVYATHIEVSVG